LVNRSALYAPARAQVVLARLLSKPVITAQVVGTSKLHHLDDAFSSVNMLHQSLVHALRDMPWI
jgi:aryl-alcohol dehydrogenase-like predicted oxidoreductase